MPSAQAGEVALAGLAAEVIRDRMVLVAAGRRITAAGKAARALADVDDVTQRRGWPVAGGLPLVETIARR